MVVRPPGVWKQLVLIVRVPMLEPWLSALFACMSANMSTCADLHMLPMVQGENAVSTLEVVGFMINLPLALQLEVEKGQQLSVNVQADVQSCIAPNLPSAPAS
jgi:hypothetical protein